MSILLLLGLLQIALIKPHYRDDRIKSIEILANTITDEIITNENIEVQNVDKTFDSILNNNVCALVINDKKQVVYQSDTLGATCMFNHEITIDDTTFITSKNPGYFITKLQKDKEYSNTFLSDISDRDMLVYAKEVRANLGNYYLFINSPLEPVESIVDFFINQYSFIAIMVFLVAIFVSLLLTNKIALPIVKMKKEANKLVEGDYSASFKGDSFNEINELADTLNLATDKLSKMDELRKDLIANVSHDIKTPLTMIKAYSEMIKDISGDNKVKRNEHLDVIIKESDYLDRLVTDMRELSKMQRDQLVLNRTNFDLKDVVMDVASLHTNMIKNKEINLKLELVSVIVWADEIKISQVISNFLSNAINHSDNKTTITIKIIDNEDYTRLEVIDNGSGIAKEDLPYIWDRYYKIDKGFRRDVNSTGLGLAIVRAILEAHKFKYGVNSKLDVGSTFYFEISKDYEEEDEGLS